MRLFSFDPRPAGVLRTTVALVAAFAVAACSSAATPSPTAAPTAAPSQAAVATADPFAELVTKAKAEGTLTWYTTVPPAPNAALAKAFTDKYGIKVEVNRQTSATLAPLFDAEVKSGKIIVDVLELGDVGILQKASDAGYFVKQSATTLPVLKTWPSKWAYGDTMYPQAIAIYGITYNTKLAAGNDVPNQWSALIDPKWRGKILMTDPRVQSGPVELLRLMRKAFGDGFLRALGQQQLQFSTSAVNSVNSVAAGDVVLSFAGIHWITTDLMAKGAPVDDTFPAPALSGSEQWAAQVKGSPHPNAAQLFLNFALSEEGQIATCAKQCSSVINAKDTIPFPDSYESPAINSPALKTELLNLIGLQG